MTVLFDGLCISTSDNHRTSLILPQVVYRDHPMLDYRLAVCPSCGCLLEYMDPWVADLANWWDRTYTHVDIEHSETCNFIHGVVSGARP